MHGLHMRASLPALFQLIRCAPAKYGHCAACVPYNILVLCVCVTGYSERERTRGRLKIDAVWYHTCVCVYIALRETVLVVYI